MALRGCINIDRLPLQILLKDNPAWAGTPVAVTRDQKPQSPILALNREARQKGLATGMRYASALSIVPNLRAREVSQDRVAEARERIVRSLSAFTPDIEPCPFDTDALWVNVDGLRSLFRSESLWSEQVRASLAAEGFRVSVVIGFTRFGTYAIARSRSRSMVFASPQEERDLMCRSSIDILPLPHRTKSTLRRLEIRTVRQFVSLPEGDTVRRFGKEAGLLRQAILSDDPLPVQSLAPREAIPCTRHLDSPLTDLNLLMPCIDELLVAEAGRAEREGSVISVLTVMLRTEEGELTTDLIRPAIPTIRTAPLRRLVELRLSARRFTSGVEDIEIRSGRAKPSRAQEELFKTRGRDLQAGARAFAAIRARFGNDSVMCTKLVDSHLPEKSFRWVPVNGPALPAPRDVTPPTERPNAVRRFLFTPAQTRMTSHKAGSAAGPFILSGSWWGEAGEDAPYLRHYYFRKSEAEVLWLYLDALTGVSWVRGLVD